MSLIYNDLTTYKGILQGIERECGFNLGDISGSTSRKVEVTADINIALDEAYSIIIPASGVWALDDSNHTDFPEITTNLVSGQRDYTFTTDGSSNLVLDIYKVFAKDSSGIFHEMTPRDPNTESDTNGFTDGQNLTGTPTEFDMMANGILLNRIPSYNSTNGLKVRINREGSYFTTSDTTKKPGFAGLFHEYLVVNPSYKYASRKGLSNEKSLLERKMRMEQMMKEYYSQRTRYERPRLRITQESTR